MIKRSLLICIFCLLSLLVFSYSNEVQSIIESIKNKSIADALEYLESKTLQETDVHNKRDLLCITASLQESSGFFEMAGKNYEKAAALQAGAGSESAASLLLNAARCALSYGDFQRADTYLSAVARTSVPVELGAKIKLYAIWSWLSKITDDAALHEPVVILSSYIDMKGMETVQSSILLTLWYLTGESSYSNTLVTKYPHSMETAVVNKNVQLMPGPFWYFVPRKSASVIFESAVIDTEPDVEGKEPADEGSTIILHYQLGFFRDKDNAKDLMQRLQDSGFSPSIKEEPRQSGTTYFAVIVKESSSKDMGARLKNAGFECYPVFE